MTDFKELREARIIQADAVRAVAVEAIRAVTGCPDILGSGISLVDEIERVCRQAAKVAPPAEYSSLLDRLEAAERDAERYRWLRSSPLFFGWEHDFRADEVDREVDAAMKEQQP